MLKENAINVHWFRYVKHMKDIRKAKKKMQRCVLNIEEAWSRLRRDIKHVHIT